MAKYNALRSFYASAAWINFRAYIIAERGLVCEHCGKEILKERDATVHHVTELTPENVHDAVIALNPENVLLVHSNPCHDEIHQRFGYVPEKKVWVVYGPPLSGKTTFVAENKDRNDLVVDMDQLYKAITLLPGYDKPDILLINIRAIYNTLIDNIKTRYGKWHSAWIVTGGADKYKRERMAGELGAELIFCDVSKKECLRRLSLDEGRKYRQDEWREYIEKWFREYTK